MKPTLLVRQNTQVLYYLFGFADLSLGDDDTSSTFGKDNFKERLAQEIFMNERGVALAHSIMEINRVVDVSFQLFTSCHQIVVTLSDYDRDATVLKCRRALRAGLHDYRLEFTDCQRLLKDQALKVHAPLP